MPSFFYFKAGLVGVEVSCKSAYDLVKIKSWSNKQSHKLDRIGVQRIRTFPFLPILVATLLHVIQ